MQNEKVTSLPNYRKFDDVPKFFEALCNKEIAEIKQKADKVNHMQNEKVTSLPNYRKFDDVPKFFEALCNKEMLSGQKRLLIL
ncbi:hypothetical protein YC2023_010750 [Brassica napus]